MALLTLDDFFLNYPDSKLLFDSLLETIQQTAPCELRVTKSQIAFRRQKPFAWAWIPEQFLRRPAAPLVLSIAFPHRDPSPRWKQIVEPYPGRFMHHLELHSAADLDAEVRAWLRSAWERAGALEG